jgi:hypothetical protein
MNADKLFRKAASLVKDAGAIRLLDIAACPLCGSTTRRDLGGIRYGASPVEFSGGGLEISHLHARLYSCSACSPRWSSPILDPEATAHLYAQSAPTRWDGSADRFEQLLAKAGVVIPPGPGRELDYGGFTGGLLDCFGRC